MIKLESQMRLRLHIVHCLDKDNIFGDDIQICYFVILWYK